MHYRRASIHFVLAVYLIFCSTLARAVAQTAGGQAALPKAKPVPRLQVIPLPYNQASIVRDGREFSRYHFGALLKRPFLFPLIGPSGRSVTRMGHPHDPNGHSHHNSVWISHHDVGGVDFWGDRGQGRIHHRRVVEYSGDNDLAVVEVLNDWKNEDGKVLMEERRRMRFFSLPKKQWLLVLDLTFSAPQEDVTLGKTPFGVLGVRMAKTIGVHDGGGLIRNSEGAVNEKEVFWKKAKWVDYSGNIAPDAAEGVTLMDHPGNPNHPSNFHVRNDGWMGASLTFDGPRVIQPGKPLSLRYGLLIHSGVPSAGRIEKQYDSFIKESGVFPGKKASK